MSGFGADQGGEARAGVALRSAGEPGKAGLKRGSERTAKRRRSCEILWFKSTPP